MPVVAWIATLVEALLARFVPGLIAAAIGAFSWLFRTQLGRWVASLLIFFGLSFSTQHFVVQPFIDQAKAMFANAGGGSGDYGQALAAWLGVLNFDKAFTMICSAVLTRFGVNAGKVFLTRKVAA